MTHPTGPTPAVTSEGPTARMWEARAVSQQAAEELVDWVYAQALPAMGEPAPQQVRVFRGDEARVVVVTWWPGPSRDLPPPPQSLVARTPHAWDFTDVTRTPQ
jgi:hypothetical protein